MSASDGYGFDGLMPGTPGPGKSEISVESMAATPSLSGGPRQHTPKASRVTSHVRVIDLVHPQYRRRRVAFNGVVGTFIGIARTMAMGISDSVVGDGGSQHLCLRDDDGREHYLEFEVEDTVTLVGEPR